MIKLGSAQNKILTALEMPSTNISYFHDMKSLVSATGLLPANIQKSVNKLVQNGMVITENRIRQPPNGVGLPKRYKVYMGKNMAKLEKALVEFMYREGQFTTQVKG
ncbi:MAG TPA: hypothetical protein EYN67_13655 [Flavobacteriales bacterium]|nr:hypothetical protein [Flavobacteriales bacterium]